jgi:hypothetical protein
MGGGLGSIQPEWPGVGVAGERHGQLQAEKDAKLAAIVSDIRKLSDG